MINIVKDTFEIIKKMIIWNDNSMTNINNAQKCKGNMVI